MKRGTKLVLLASAAAMASARRRGGAIDAAGPAGFALPDGERRTVLTDDGASLEVLVAGPPQGPTVVLCHCWTGAMDVWAPVARRLVRLGHRVVLYNHRGHGSSTFGNGLDGVARLGDDLATVLAALDLTDVALVGHSMGGMTVQAYMGGHREDAAARVVGVVLVSTASRTLGRALPAFVAETVMGDAWLARVKGTRFGHAMVRRSLGRRPVEAHATLVHDLLHATPRATRVACLLAMASMDLRSGLAKAHVPATVLVGTRDRLTPPRLARHLAGAWPGATVRLLPGVGHMLPMEAPDDVVEAVARTAAGAAESSAAPSAPTPLRISG